MNDLIGRIVWRPPVFVCTEILSIYSCFEAFGLLILNSIFFVKIALIDNTNNNFFSLFRYFHAMDVEADLYLTDNTPSHFHPSADTWDIGHHAASIYQFNASYSILSFFFLDKRALFERFKDYDCIIACGHALAILRYVGIDVDMFVPFGGDLFNFPFPFRQFYHFRAWVKLPLLPLYFLRSRLQRSAIKNSRYIICNTNWTHAKNALNSLGVSAFNYPRIMVYKQEPQTEILDKYQWLRQHDFVVFSPTRHSWHSNYEHMPDFSRYGGSKRNDKLIYAFCDFIQECSYQLPLLLLVDYGCDVIYSKKLIRSLGIESYVSWLPLLPRKEITAIMTLSSLVADQFRVNMNGTSAGVTNEAMAYGVPVITNTENSLVDMSDPYFNAPILHANSRGQILQHFIDYSSNPESIIYSKTAISCWFDKNLGAGLVEKYVSLLACL